MHVLMFGFLYFPEDKSLYVPAAIELLIMLALCVGVFMLFKKLNKKQIQKAKALEERILHERKEHIKGNH